MCSWTLQDREVRQVVWLLLCLLAALGMGSFAVAAAHPVLPLGTSVTGQLGPAHGDDWYQVTIDYPGRLTVRAEAAADLPIQMRLYYNDSILHSDTGGSSTIREVERADLHSGTYLVRVSRAGGEGSYSLRAVHTPSTYREDPKPNESVADAIPLDLGHSTQGMLGYFMQGRTDGEDWYRFTTTVPGHVVLQVQAEETLTIQTRLYAPNAATILHSDTGGTASARTVERPDLQPETYYLRISRSGGHGGYEIQPQFIPQTIPDDQEPNDTVEQAQTIPLDVPSTGLLGYQDGSRTDGEDWFVFEVPDPGHVRFIIQGEDTLTIQARLYAPNASTILHSDTGGTASARAVERPDLQPATYYLRISRSGGHGGYEIQPLYIPQSIVEDQEPNDTAEEAKAIPLDAPSTGLLGYQDGSRTDGEDWFYFVVPEPGAAHFAIAAEDTLTIQARLYAPNASSILHSDTGGTASARTVERPDLQPETYYLRISRSGGYGGYTIEPRFEPQALLGDPEPNDTLEEAGLLPLNMVSTGILGYTDGSRTDGEDWYAISLPSSGQLTVAVEAQETLQIQTRLYAANGSTILHGDTGGTSSTRTVTRPDLRSDTYYLRVSRSGGYGGYEIVPVFSAVVDTADAVPAASVGEGRPLAIGQLESGILGFVQGSHTDGESWYRLEPIAAGPLQVSVVAQTPLTNQLRLYNEAGSSILQSDTGGSSVTRLVSLDADAGIYTVRISRSGGQGPYFIQGRTDTSGVWTNPRDYTFAAQRLEDSPAEMHFAFVNAGSAAVPIQRAQIVGADAASFELTTAPAGEIPGRQQVIAAVQFMPQSAGHKEAALEVVTSAGTHSIPLQGLGFVQFPDELDKPLEEVPEVQVTPPAPEVTAPPATAPSEAPTAEYHGPDRTPYPGLYAWTEYAEYGPQDEIVVHYLGLPGNQQDWITVVPASYGDSTYAQWSYTNGARSGTKVFSALEPGDYEVRVFFNWPDGGYTVQSRYPFVVRAGAAPRTSLAPPDQSSVTAPAAPAPDSSEAATAAPAPAQVAVEPEAPSATAAPQDHHSTGTEPEHDPAALDMEAADSQTQPQTAAAAELGDLDTSLLQPPPPLPLEERLAEIDANFAASTRAQINMLAGLAAQGTSGVATAVPYLSHEDDDLVRAALQAVTEIGIGAVQAVPALLALLDHGTDRVRREAVDALLAVDSRDENVIAALLQFGALDMQQNTRAASNIVRALAARLDTVPVQSLGHLAALTTLSGWDYGDKAQMLLARQGDAALEIVIPRLRSGSEVEQFGAARTLLFMGPRAAVAVPELLGASQSQNELLRRLSLDTLTAVAPHETAVQERFVQALQDENSHVVAAAARGLAAAPEPQASTLQPLFTALEAWSETRLVTTPLLGVAALYGEAVFTQAERWLQQETMAPVAVRLLGQIGPAAEGFVPTLLQIYGTDDVVLRAAVVETLGAIGGDEAMAVVRRGATDEAWRIREATAKALRQAAVTSPEDLALLEQLLADGSSTVQEAAALSMAAAGEAAQDRVLQMLQSSDPDVQMRSAYVTAHMGAAALDAAEILYGQAQSAADPELQEMLQEALWHMWSLEGMDLPRQTVQIPSVAADLAEQDWSLVVMTTKELTRLVMGPMEDHELGQLAKQWDGFLAHPSVELRAYLMQLNTLLQEFLMLRAAFVETGLNYEGTLVEAFTALGYQDVKGLEGALHLARFSRELLLGLQQQLAEKGREIVDLLPPPDPAALQEAARRRHRDALLAVSGFDMEDIGLPEETDEGYWVMTHKESTSNEGYWAGLMAMIVSERDSVKARAFVASEGMQAGTEMVTGGSFGTHRMGAAGYVSWTPPPAVVPYERRSFGFPMRVSVGFESRDEPQLDIWGQAALSINASSLWPGGLRTWGIGAYMREEQGRDEWDSWVSLPLNEIQIVSGDTDQVVLHFSVRTPSGSSQYTYTYERMHLDAATIYDLKMEDQRQALAREEQEAQNFEEYLDAHQQAESRIDGAVMRQQQAQYFREHIEHLDRQLAAESDPENRDLLAWQRMVAQANYQGEQDQLTYLQTGQFVRTPTLFDHYVRARMAEQSQQLAADLHFSQRAYAGVQRMAATLPEDERDRLMAFVDRNLDYSDIDGMRRLVDAVGEQVSGYWMGVGAEAEYQAAVMDEYEFWRQMARTGAGVVLVAAAAPAAAAYGFSAQTAAWAPTAVRIAYGGTMGFVEGGVGEAVKQSVAWSHQVGNLAVAAYDGYTTVGRDGEQGGWSGAAWNAAQSYVYGKVFEYSIQTSSRFLASKLPSLARPVFNWRTPQIQPGFADAQYTARMDQGRNLVSQWQDTQFKLAAARSSGVDGGHVDELQRQVEALVGQINASYEAKWLLKHTAPPHVHTIFNQELERVYDSVMPEFLRNLEAMGYDTSKFSFKPMRNAASGGSVGMDFDLALKEGEPFELVKNGQPVNRHTFQMDAQQAQNTAYQAVTGQSAIASDIHVTTSMHVEAFSEQALLEQNIDFTNMHPARVQQAGDVFRTKVQMSMNATQHNAVLQTQAVSRDLEKELRTKVVPFIDSRIHQEALRGNHTNVTKLQQIRAHWQQVYTRVDQVGRQTTDPYEIRRLRQELEMITGTEFSEIVDQMAYHFETLGTFFR